MRPPDAQGELQISTILVLAARSQTVHRAVARANFRRDTVIGRTSNNKFGEGGAMRLTPDEIVGTLAFGTFVGMEPDLSCRVRLHNCDGSFAEDLIVPTIPEACELVRSLRIGEWVCVHFWDGKAVGIERG